MMTTIDAWPFAITRARRTGYRAVAAPDFLLESGLAAMLHQVADGGIDEHGAYLRPFHPADGDELWCLYRAVPLRVSDVDADAPGDIDAPADKAKDEFGRPIRLIEGVVCRTRPDAGVTAAVFEAVHEALLPTLQAFFTKDSSSFRAVPGSPFPLGDVPAGEPLPQPQPLPLTEQAPVSAEEGAVPASRGPFPGPVPGRPEPVVVRMPVGVPAGTSDVPADAAVGDEPSPVPPTPEPGPAPEPVPAPRSWTGVAAASAALVILAMLVLVALLLI